MYNTENVFYSVLNEIQVLKDLIIFFLFLRTYTFTDRLRILSCYAGHVTSLATYEHFFLGLINSAVALLI